MDLIGTRYVTNTDAFLAVTDEAHVIEAADDDANPDTDARTFAELEAAADEGGPGSDAEKVRDAIRIVVSEAVKDAERRVESAGTGVYVIPYNPIDPAVVAWSLDWSWFRLRMRHQMIRPEDEPGIRSSLLRELNAIGNGDTRLSSLTAEDGGGPSDAISAYGTAERRR